MAKKILVVDDDATLLDMIRFVLEREGFEVLEAENAFKGLDIIAQEKVDLALLDVMMPKMDGLTMLAELRKHEEDLKVIIMTAVSTPETAIDALREQACDFLAKPFDVTELLSAVRAAFDLGEREIKIEVLSARPEWIELRVPCDLAAIDPLERIMKQLETDIPQETRDGVTYAFREMLRNAIEYGGKNDPQQHVEVGFLHTPRVILYRIKDPGEGFSLEALYHAAILNPEGDPIHHERVRQEKGMRPGGFGILIASNMVDEMVYNERHNEVVLIKYLNGSTPE
jgi:CheY-like chemotaxis protein/anti-sigma regulatory factor (Ser/Thr protein kinase)